MFEISTIHGEQGITVALTGRIDSTNAVQAEQEINTAISGFSGELIVDAQALTYISSAGLRVVLRLKKACPDLKIINVSPDVYDIFEMTGFTEMMDIQKAYRTVSIEGCEVIGEGANGKVYRIDPDTIVKVYKNPDSLEEIQNERELARKAFVMGVPTAIPYDVVRVGDCYGSVFELLNAKSFAKIMIEDPSQTEALARDSVAILKTIHATRLAPGELPDKKTQAVEWARFCRPYLSAGAGEKLERLLQEVPDTSNMLHADFHVKNIMRQNGENLLIDMDTLSMGHPVFEFAAIYLAYVGFSCVDHNCVKAFLGIPYEQAQVFWKATLRAYFDTSDETVLQAVEDKAAVVAYARLLRRTVNKSKDSEEVKQKMVEYCISALETLVGRVSSLSFDA